MCNAVSSITLRSPVARTAAGYLQLLAMLLELDETWRSGYAVDAQVREPFPPLCPALYLYSCYSPGSSRYAGESAEPGQRFSACWQPHPSALAACGNSVLCASLPTNWHPGRACGRGRGGRTARTGAAAGHLAQVSAPPCLSRSRPCTPTVACAVPSAAQDQRDTWRTLVLSGCAPYPGAPVPLAWQDGLHVAGPRACSAASADGCGRQPQKP